MCLNRPNPVSLLICSWGENFRNKYNLKTDVQSIYYIIFQGTSSTSYWQWKMPTFQRKKYKKKSMILYDTIMAINHLKIRHSV